MLLAPSLYDRGMQRPAAGGAAPRLPALANATVIEFGDSRVENSGGFTGGATTVVSRNSGGGFAFHWNQAIGNRLLPRKDGGYGVGSTTSLNGTYRARFASIAPSTNPAQAVTGRIANADWPMNRSSDGNFSFHANPASVAIYLNWVNDNGTTYYDTPLRTMQAVATLVDERLAANPGVIYVATGFPASTAFIEAESKVIAQGATTTAPANVNGFVDGESFGIAGVKDANGNVLTKVAGAPAAGEYSVAGNTYTFHASLTAAAAATVYLSYGYNLAGSSAFGDHPDTMRAWALSAERNFVHNAVNYGIPGLQFNRPRCRVFDSWTGVSVAISGANLYKAKHGTFDVLGVHPTPYAGVLGAKALGALFANDYGALPSLELPALGNVAWIVNSGGFTAVDVGPAGSGLVGYAGTLPASFTNRAGFQNETVFRFVNSTGVTNLIFSNDGAGNLTLANPVVPGSTAGQYSGGKINADGTWYIRGTAGQWLPAGRLFAEVGEPSTTTGVNLLVNPAFDPGAAAYIGTAAAFPATGGANPITGTPIPGWTLSVTAQLLTAIGNGTATLNVQPVHIGNGIYELEVTARGCVNVGWSLTFAANANSSLYQAPLRVPGGSRLRAYIRRKLMAGTNGRCYGVATFGSISISATGVTGITRNTSTGSTFVGSADGTAQTGGAQATVNPTVLNANVGTASGPPSQEWNDLVIADAGGGVFSEALISRDMDLTGGTLSGLNASIQIVGEANKPFSFKTRISHPAVRIVAA